MNRRDVLQSLLVSPFIKLRSGIKAPAPCKEKVVMMVMTSTVTHSFAVADAAQYFSLREIELDTSAWDRLNDK